MMPTSYGGYTVYGEKSWNQLSRGEGPCLGNGLALLKAEPVSPCNVSEV